MTQAAIIGGKLQGTEAVYLAKKAGIRSILIDCDQEPPAKGLADEFLCCDVLQETKELLDALKKADFILPAMENQDVLNTLEKLSLEHHFKLAFDMNAYRISSSKLLSDQLIHSNGISAPQYFPDCKSPYIVKPSSFSGSAGVKRIQTKSEMEEFLISLQPGESWVAQEYLEGPSYSIEIIGKPEYYRTYEVTEIHIDKTYDCCKVTAPCAISEVQRKGFQEMAVNLAGLVGLTGIMDLEVIDDEGVFKVLEIDARIPSQTPTVVYHVTGMNLLEEIRDLFCYGSFQTVFGKQKKYVSYEHLQMKNGTVSEHGEHIMGEARPLTLRENFFGACEVISDYISDENPWRGTFINWADTEEELAEKRAGMRRLLAESVKNAVKAL